MSTLFLCGKCGAKGGLHKEVDPITKIPEIHCVICGNIWWPGSQAGKRPNPIGGQWPEPIKKPEPVKPPETIQTTAMQESAHPLFEGVTVSKKGRSSWNIKGICSNCGRPNMQMARRHPNPLCGTCYYEVLHRDSGMTEEEALMRVKIRIHKKILQKEEAAIGLPKNKKTGCCEQD